MNNNKKAILLVLCAVMLVAASVFGTVAYLTDTDEATNTFTVGNVAIKLDEAKVDEYGVAVTPAERVTENEYKLIPGHTYTKDPTVTVENGSEEAYIRMIVTVKFTDEKALSDENLATKLDNIFTGYDVSKWALGGAKKTFNHEDMTITYEYRYFETVDARNEAKVLEPLFEEIKVPGNLTNDTLAVFNNMEINIVAHAIQADSFADADAAWAAFDASTPTS